MFCKECGCQISDSAAICVKCGVPTGTMNIAGYNEIKPRYIYVLLGFFLGTFGIHNFYAGYSQRAVIQLLITLLAGWLILPLGVVWLWAIIEICAVTQDAKGVPFS